MGVSEGRAFDNLR